MTPVSSFLMQATFAHVESQRALKCWIINHKCNFKIIFSFFTSLALPAAENSDLGASTGGLSHLRVIFFLRVYVQQWCGMYHLLACFFHPFYELAAVNPQSSVFSLCGSKPGSSAVTLVAQVTWYQGDR